MHCGDYRYSYSHPQRLARVLGNFPSLTAVSYTHLMICRVRLEEFSKGIVLPPEFTLSKAKEDRLNRMKATNCNFCFVGNNPEPVRYVFLVGQFNIGRGLGKPVKPVSYTHLRLGKLPSTRARRCGWE